MKCNITRPGLYARASLLSAGRLSTMDRLPPDPHKLLEAWMEWEHGDTPPGRVMANLKTGGLRDLLEQLVAERPSVVLADAALPATEAWTPVV